MQFAAHQNRQERRNNVYRRNVSGLRSVCFPLCRWPGRVWTDQPVLDSKACGGQLKACGNLSSVIGESASEFKSVICLHTFYLYTMVLEPNYHFFRHLVKSSAEAYWKIFQRGSFYAVYYNL